MKPNARFVNTFTGSIVDEAALMSAAGAQDRGAAVDDSTWSVPPITFRKLDTSSRASHRLTSPRTSSHFLADAAANIWPL